MISNKLKIMRLAFQLPKKRTAFATLNIITSMPFGLSFFRLWNCFTFYFWAPVVKVPELETHLWTQKIPGVRSVKRAIAHQPNTGSTYSER